MTIPGGVVQLAAASAARRPGLAQDERPGAATSLLRRTPIAGVEIALHGPRRAAVLLHPAPGRWPEHESADRLGLGLGLVALAASGTAEPRWEAFRAILAQLASRIAGTEREILPGDLVPLQRFGVPGALAVVAWEGPGRGRVEAHLLETRGGLVPRLVDHPEEAGPLKEIAALALLVALAADADPDRLTLALGIEGILAWYRETDRLSPPRNVLNFALAHAAGRLAESGRSLPAGL